MQNCFGRIIPLIHCGHELILLQVQTPIVLEKRRHGVTLDHTIQMNELGKLLVIFGLMIAGIGLLIWTGFGRGWLGRLPGDIHYTKGDFSFHFPIVTCLLVSIILTFLLWLFRK
jgi:hypothetical protein